MSTRALFLSLSLLHAMFLVGFHGYLAALQILLHLTRGLAILSSCWNPKNIIYLYHTNSIFCRKFVCVDNFVLLIQWRRETCTYNKLERTVQETTQRLGQFLCAVYCSGGGGNSNLRGRGGVVEGDEYNSVHH